MVLSLFHLFWFLLFIGTYGYTRNDFPKDFTFGAGISAYQWEGAAGEDGRKPSFWDTFAYSRNDGNGDIACDGYHKYKEDVKLMVETGLDAFRFSISWSRLIPNGRGHVNPKGLEFYKNFIQELVNNGIEPHVTLFHYDLPQSLEDEYGGWIDRRIIKDFTAYAEVCFKEFGNNVKFWTTINEVNVFTIGGYNDGITPPGRCSIPGNNCTTGNSSTEPYLVGHNVLLAHASASRLYKQKYKDMQGGFIGFSLYALGIKSNNDETTTKRFKVFYFDWMLEPLIFGHYPSVMRRTVGSRLPYFSKEESELVKGSFDFIGIIHYFPANVTNTRPHFYGHPDFNSDMGVTITLNFEFHIVPSALEDVLEYIKQTYDNPPIDIHENGRPMKGDSQLPLKDTPRIEYLDAYIGAVLKAIRNGSDMRGYFVWSMMDLYEIFNGYEAGYGLYYVNFSDANLRRSPKLSAHWYSAFLKGNTSYQGIDQLHNNFTSSS